MIWQFNQSYGLGVLALSTQLKLKTYSGLYGNFDYKSHILGKCFGFFLDNLTGLLWVDGYREDIDVFWMSLPILLKFFRLNDVYRSFRKGEFVRITQPLLSSGFE